MAVVVATNTEAHGFIFVINLYKLELMVVVVMNWGHQLCYRNRDRRAEVGYLLARWQGEGN